ncbi:MAG: hypothetical protein II596_07155, partial [Thermoguttaceae bacterium]|nr:hypothetical protein [Thermoguttaceae bacterium]
LEKYVIVLEQLETVFPKEYSFQQIVREDKGIVSRLDDVAQAEKYIRQEMEDGKLTEAEADAFKLTNSWALFNSDGDIYALSPIQETTDGYFNALKLWIETCERMPKNEFELAKQTGRFNDYPGKSFAEFILQKADDNYSEIERLEVERINDSSKNFENLEKEVALWAKVIERAPILKYDTTSEIYQRIQEVVQQYKMELTKQNKPVPEDFPLKSFEETAVQLISN